MQSIYLEKNDSIAYFIESYDNYPENDFNDFAVPNNGFNPIAPVAESAFAHSSVEKILFKDNSPDIGESAFENCESLTTVIFGNLVSSDTYLYREVRSTLNGVQPNSADDDYTVQANAFKGCGKLATLVLPKVDDEHKLVIGSDAFYGCGALRTMVALCDKIDFAGNPFPKVGERLTFICKKDSELAQFARDNGYRTVYID